MGTKGIRRAAIRESRHYAFDGRDFPCIILAAMESRPNCTAKAALSAFPAATLLVALSVHFLDQPIALAVGGLIRSHELLARYTGNLPDLLLPLVLLLSAGMWAAYFRRVHGGHRDDRAHFHRLAGTALPAAFALKTALKYLFGRVETRAWLESPEVHTFLWFRGGESHTGFPSGHMTVFAALAAASWIFLPRTRFLGAAVLTLLGAALILTDYHFLGDVIAGAYLGWAVVAAICRALEKRPV
jgi:membrane-associated phospholipid phosphatase